CWFDRRVERTSGNFPALVWQSDSDRRQQIFRAELSGFQRRLVHLRAARCESETSAASILPHLRGELWPILAHSQQVRRKFRGEVLSIALANNGQHQDTGAKMIHAADETTSNIISKSISIGTGRATYRGLVHVPKHLKNCKNNTECDALLINATSRTDTYPAITVRGTGNAVQHEASVSQVSAEQIFYMQQRGLTEAQAMSLSVN